MTAPILIAHDSVDQASVDRIEIGQSHQIHAPPFRGLVNRLDRSVPQWRSREAEVPRARVKGLDMQIGPERTPPPLRP